MTAISIVAFGVSMPDTFSSISLAVDSHSADEVLTDITTSNAVSMFLGLGIHWIIKVVYYGAPYQLPKDSLYPIVSLFLIFSAASFLVLVIKRFVSAYLFAANNHF